MNITNRIENQFIRNLFKLASNHKAHDVISHYNDLRTNRHRRRRRVFKTKDISVYELAWRRVLEQLDEVGLTGWRLYKGTSMDGEFKVGIQKYQAQ